jgi:hypothetical protein
MPIITPPFRTSLLTANGVPFATDNGDIQTTRDWWLYWNQLTDRSNSNSKLATAGTHGDRPSPDGMPEGALYYENDRGVLYASTLGVWQYVAGTMWGTLFLISGLRTCGTHDAGFDFRTNVAPAREFIWSQTAWVEITQDNLLQYAAATGNLTLSTSFANVPGATLTLTRAGRYLVTATVCFVGSGSGDFSTTLQFQGQAQLVADGVAQTALADTSPLMASSSVAMILTVYQQWSWQATAPGKVLQLQGNKTGGTGGSVIFSRDTSLSALWVSP